MYPRFLIKIFTPLIFGILSKEPYDAYHGPKSDWQLANLVLSTEYAVSLAFKYIRQIHWKCGLQNTQKQTKGIFKWRYPGIPVDG